MISQQKTRNGNAYPVQSVYGLFVANGECVGFILCHCHYQSSDAKNDTLDNLVESSQQKSFKLTKSVSSIMDSILNAHSFTLIISGCLRYRRSNVRAAFFFTKLCEVLWNVKDIRESRNRHAHGDINRR